MELNLTSKWQFSYHDNDGKDRNYILFFLNGVLILKQKCPYDTNWERLTSIYDVYLLNGKLYQKRRKNFGCSHPDNDKTKIREVSFPISKKILKQFNIPNNTKILENNE